MAYPFSGGFSGKQFGIPGSRKLPFRPPDNEPTAPLRRYYCFLRGQLKTAIPDAPILSGEFVPGVLSEDTVIDEMWEDAGESSLLTGLAAYWKLDELAGAARVDNIGTADLTESSPNVASVSGLLGNCAQFIESSSALLGTPSQASTRLVNTSFTVVLWSQQQPHNLTHRVLGCFQVAVGGWDILKVGNFGGSVWTFRLALGTGGANSISVTGHNNNTIDPGTDPSGSDEWEMIYVTFEWGGQEWDDPFNPQNNAVVISRSRITFDEFTTSASLSNEVRPSTIDFQIGLGGGLDPQRRNIDEVGIWHRVLSNSELLELWNNGLGLTHPFS
jgi:hypothetical protein